MFKAPTFQPGNLAALQCGECGAPMLILRRYDGVSEWACGPCGLSYVVPDVAVAFDSVSTVAAKAAEGK